jgi:uncharacterized protein (DUF4415 family)
MRDEYDFSSGKRGPIIKAAKTRVTIFLDDDILEVFRARAEKDGKGYQTLINDALRGVIAPDAAPVTLSALRRILREELHAA